MGKRRLVLLVVALTAVLVVPLHFAGDSTRTRVAWRGLELRYWKGSDRGPVYIEGGSGRPLGPAMVGLQPVEIVSRGDLTARYAGKEVAPELTTVSVAEEHDLLGLRYTVTASSFGFRVPGATAIPWGGTRIYYFRQWAGLLCLVGEDVIRH